MKKLSSFICTSALFLTVFVIVIFSCKKAVVVDKCASVVCKHDGKCFNGLCTCPSGWKGTHCDTSVFVGSWIGSEVATGANSLSANYNVNSYNLIISQSSDSLVSVKNLENINSNLSVEGTLSTDGKTITITDKTITDYNSGNEKDDITYDGTISLGNTDNVISISFLQHQTGYGMNGDYRWNITGTFSR